MSKQQQNKPQAPAPAPSQPEMVAEMLNGTTVLAEVPKGVMTPAQLTKAALAAANSEAMLAAVANFGDRLRALGEKYPEYADRLETLASYTESNIEGMVEERMPPIVHLQMKQASTRSAPEKAKAGDWYTKTGDILGPSFTFIPVLTHNKRTYFKQGQERPECVSDDGKVGSKYGECQHCPYGRFEEGTKSACSSGYAFTILKSDFSELYQLDFMKTSAKSGKALSKMLKYPGIFAKTYTITSEKESNSQGSFYVAKSAPTGDSLEGAELEIAREVSAFARLRYEYFRTRRGESNAARGIGTGGATGALPAGDNDMSSNETPDV